MNIHGTHSLQGQGANLIPLIAHLLDDERQCVLSLLKKVSRLLSRQARYQMVEGGKSGIDEGGMRGAGGETQGFEDGSDAGIGNIVLLNAGLDGIDVLNFGVDGNIFSQDGQQASNLLISKFFGHDPQKGMRTWQLFHVLPQNGGFKIVSLFRDEAIQPGAKRKKKREKSVKCLLR